MIDRLLDWAERHPLTSVVFLALTFVLWALPALFLGIGIMAYEGIMENRA
jgi:cytochrome c-type biogenesis protein CcmH/NrfF